MAAHGEGRAGDVVDTTMPPSPPALPVSASDTPSAPSGPSAPSEVVFPRPAPSSHHPSSSAQPLDETLRPLPSPRNGRSFSLAHLSGPIKRKPLSSTASPAAVRFSKGAAVYADILADLPRPEQRFARSCSLDSPTLYEFPGERSPLPTTSSSALVSDYFAQATVPPSVATGHDAACLRNTAGINPAAPQTHPARPQEDESPSVAETVETASQSSFQEEAEEDGDEEEEGGDPYELDDLYSVSDSRTSDDGLESRGTPREDDEDDDDKRSTIIDPNARTMSMFSRKSPPPQLKLAPTNTRDEPPSAATDSASALASSSSLEQTSSKLSAFFGWATSPEATVATEFSDKDYSPIPSPSSPKQAAAVIGSYDDAPLSAPRDRSFSHATEQDSLQYCESYLQTPADPPSSLGQLEEMEDELKAISVELASSIRREMDLEDLVDRLQEQVSNPQAPGKRTSDYFSDSGYSSAKFSDYDQAKEEISQIQRRAEQEKAQIRLELTNKLQDERSKRRELDQQIQELSKKASEFDVAQIDTSDATNRVQELESACEELSRKLSVERNAKTDLEGLLRSVQGELQTAANERDNLRDEVVPQLRSRLEGLEAEAADQARSAYDASKMQQELQNLKSENAELQMLRSENAELRMLGSRDVAEHKQTTVARMSMGLSRSASVTGGPLRHKRPQSISRSASTRVNEPRDVLAERLKDVEAQRDALHSALKSLLERQEIQNRENAKRIHHLEMERDRLLTASPKKVGYEREVSNLREEIAVLRRRAEEAIEQKWQVEKGLAGLKMDLDRAEGEIASLRGLLKENDILIPEAFARPGSSHSEEGNDTPVSSQTLEKAYHDLQRAYMDAIDRIKALEENTRPDEKTQLAIERLEQSLAATVSDRDSARADASAYLDQIDNLQALEKQHLDTENDLASQLHESARRVEELAQQVRAQLDANATLRTRLADTIARGDAEQRVSTERIAGMQSRLRTLEEQVEAAQSAAEERIARHEDEVSELKDAHSDQLQRLRDAMGGRGPRRGSGQPRVFPGKSPLSPMFINLKPQTTLPPRKSSLSPSSHENEDDDPTSPRPTIRRAATAPVDMISQVSTLQSRVSELEGALASADAEMQEVVGRMNTAQIEVLRLQEAREEAVRETRRLQRVLEEERMAVRGFEGRWRAVTGA
ncbi:uncharacterized protein C8A04DRAFT_35796 [Dichotomopilus funicola]|uniref:DUF7603 domain-containing protein n=1 Tax=Dichotomopilus funicola TaxID=1934379 RepID=A0AAN6ZPS7_9PEZI|nr:hypothetical protein C8A04DRAFT_35796 [Dichotomopilus funicola]